MKLSTRVRYGLRALVELAEMQKDVPVLLDSVASRQEISRKYLDAIFSRLRSAGIVRSSRGAGGGFQLTRPPDQITLADVYSGLEGSIHLVDCVDRGHQCGYRDLCPTWEVWADLSELMRDFLDSITLADLVRKKQEIAASGTSMYYI